MRSIFASAAMAAAAVALTAWTNTLPTFAETAPAPMQAATATLEPRVLSVASEAFEAGGPIPRKYSGEGQDVSPPLTWSDAPEGTKEIALICDDPDAPGTGAWVHWVAYGISGRERGIAEGQKQPLVEGKNSWGRLGYGGPLPPKGHGVHHYHFKIYALDTPLQAAPGMTKDQLLAAMDRHVIATGEVVGTYLRQE